MPSDPEHRLVFAPPGPKVLDLGANPRSSDADAAVFHGEMLSTPPATVPSLQAPSSQRFDPIPSAPQPSVDEPSNDERSSQDGSPSMLPDVQPPRQFAVVTSYLQDPSLRYSSMPLAGPSVARVVLMVLGCLLAASLAVVPFVRALLLGSIWGWKLLWIIGFAVVGIAICAELLFPTIAICREVCTRCWLRRRLRTVQLGMERAVPQPGTALRYEVHLCAKKSIDLQFVHVRLVFWEAWHEKDKLRILRLPRKIVQKRGHDLVRHELQSLRLKKGEHGVIRGSIAVPTKRPSEHYRGKFKHISYVNLTVSLACERQEKGGVIQGNCPRLVTFPWI